MMIRFIHRYLFPITFTLSKNFIFKDEIDSEEAQKIITVN